MNFPLLLVAMIVLGCQVDGARILFLYALDSDLQGFKEEMGDPIRVATVRGQSISEFRHEGNIIDVMRMGSGVVQTASRVSAYCAVRKPDVCFSVGVSGGLDESLVVGDWVRVRTVMPWQSGAIEDASGQVFGSAMTMPPYFPANLPQELAFPEVSAASGDAFIASSGFRSVLAQRSASEIVEMNLLGCLIGLGDKPPHGLHLRVISDYADDDARLDFAKFRESYDGQAGRWIGQLVKKLPPDLTSPYSYESLRSLTDPFEETE